MFAGKSLAEMQVAVDADASLLPHVVSELTARVERAGKSAPNAQKALDRIAQGGTIAIPAPEPKAPKAQAGTTTRGGQVLTQAQAQAKANPNLPIVAAKAQAVATGPKATEKAVWAFVAKALKAGGHPVPRAISKAARTGSLAPKVTA
jgi:hypothetical protein